MHEQHINVRDFQRIFMIKEREQTDKPNPYTPTLLESRGKERGDKQYYFVVIRRNTSLNRKLCTL